MSRDEAPLSTHPASQAWVAMWLANDPNTALIGALRASQQHPLWTALRRPFERQTPCSTLAASDTEIPGLRPRPARWIGVGLGLALGVVLAAVGLGKLPLELPGALTAFAAVPSEPVAATTLQLRPAPSPPLAAPIATAVVPAAPGTDDRAHEAPAAVLPRAAAATPAASTTKKKPAARRLRRGIARAIRGENRP